MNNDNEELVRKYINPMTSRDFLTILVIGLFVGSATWVFNNVLGNYLFGPLLCNGALTSDCSNGLLVTNIVVAVITGVIALTALIRYRASRPLLAVLAVTVCLWSIIQNLDSFNTFIEVAAIIILYSLTYGLFAWVMRIRSSWIVAVVTVVLIVVGRLVFGG